MEWQMKVVAQKDLDRELRPFLTARRVHRPSGGWLRTVRKALGLSAAAISQDLHVSGWVKAGFIAVAAYFLAVPFLRHSPWADS